MLCKLSEALSSQPDFKPTWNAEPPDALAFDPKFGMIAHAVSVNDCGELQHDIPIWLERTGAISIPIDQDDRIALVRNFRAAAAAPDELGSFPRETFSDLGRMSLELPRGFPEPDELPEQAALREAKEETGYPASSAIHLGASNCNTTYFPISLQVFLVRIDSSAPRQQDLDEAEEIDQVLLKMPSEVMQLVAEGEIFCGITKSALLSYFAWREHGRGARKR